MDPTLMWVIRIVVIAACFAIGWYGMDYFLSRPKTYTNPSGTFSFSYPGKWKKVDTSGSAFTSFAGGMNAELGLADGTSDANSNYIVFVANVPVAVDWATAKARLQSSSGESMSASLPQGATMTARTFTEVTVDGKPGLSIRFSVTAGGTTYACDMTVVLNGQTLQAILLMAKQPKGSTTKMQDILKTVKFKS
jgi:hypothetical protein